MLANPDMPREAIKGFQPFNPTEKGIPFTRRFYRVRYLCMRL